MLITIITVPPKYIYFRFLLFELFYTHETGAIFNDSRIQTLNHWLNQWNILQRSANEQTHEGKWKF